MKKTHTTGVRGWPVPCALIFDGSGVKRFRDMSYGNDVTDSVWFELPDSPHSYVLWVDAPEMEGREYGDEDGKRFQLFRFPDMAGADDGDLDEVMNEYLVDPIYEGDDPYALETVLMKEIGF